MGENLYFGITLICIKKLHEEYKYQAIKCTMGQQITLIIIIYFPNSYVTDIIKHPLNQPCGKRAFSVWWPSTCDCKATVLTLFVTLFPSLSLSLSLCSFIVLLKCVIIQHPSLPLEYQHTLSWQQHALTHLSWRGILSNPASSPKELTFHPTNITSTVCDCMKLHLHLSLNLEGFWGTTDDFTTSFLHFSLFSTALGDLANSRPVRSLMLSSHLFLCLPCLLSPFTVPWKTVQVRPDEWETCQYHFSLHLLMMVRRSSCGPTACWIMARTSSLVAWSL